ncbi:hypothetical protein ACK3TF_000364 [Chlorella vulgaris]
MATEAATPRARRSTQRATNPAPTPRTTRRAAALAAASDSGAEAEVAEETPKPAPRTTRRRAPAAKKPAEPALVETPAASTEEEEEQEQALPSRSPARRRDAAAAQSAEKEAEELSAVPPTSNKSHAAADRKPIGAIGTPLFLLLLVSALGMSGLYAATPYCQHRDCVELARNLPGLAAEAAAEGYSQLREKALHGAAAVHSQLKWEWEALLSMLGRGTESGVPSSLCHFDAAAALRGLMPAGQDFEALHAAASAVLSSGGVEPESRAYLFSERVNMQGSPAPRGNAIRVMPAVALLVCELAAACEASLEHLDAAVADREACMLHVDAAELGHDAEALQGMLASFLRDSPTGIVVVRRIDEMSTALLPVLEEATADSGLLVGPEGDDVATTEATFFFTSHIPASLFDSVRDAVKFKLDVKNHLVVDLALRAPSEVKGEVTAEAKALRRHIDFVIPVGLEPAAEEFEVEAGDLHPAQCALDPSILSTLLPEGDAWAALKESAASIFGEQRQAAGTEPAVVLFVCAADELCEMAVAEAVRLTLGGPDCILILEGASLSDSQEMLATLSAFLEGSPSGTLLINRVDQMAPELLAVLVDALSSGGALLPGANSDMPAAATDATFLLTSLMPPSVFRHLDEQISFRQDVYLHLLADLRARAADKDAGSALAETLQQRLDGLLPLRLSYEAAAAATDEDLTEYAPAIESFGQWKRLPQEEEEAQLIEGEVEEEAQLVVEPASEDGEEAMQQSGDEAQQGEESQGQEPAAAAEEFVTALSAPDEQYDAGSDGQAAAAADEAGQGLAEAGGLSEWVDAPAEEGEDLEFASLEEAGVLPRADEQAAAAGAEEAEAIVGEAADEEEQLPDDAQGPDSAAEWEAAEEDLYVAVADGEVEQVADGDEEQLDPVAEAVVYGSDGDGIA